MKSLKKSLKSWRFVHDPEVLEKVLEEVQMILEDIPGHLEGVPWDLEELQKSRVFEAFEVFPMIFEKVLRALEEFAEVLKDIFQKSLKEDKMVLVP